MVRMTNARRPRIRPRSSLTPTAPIALAEVPERREPAARGDRRRPGSAVADRRWSGADRDRRSSSSSAYAASTGSRSGDVTWRKSSSRSLAARAKLTIGRPLATDAASRRADAASSPRNPSSIVPSGRIAALATSGIGGEPVPGRLERLALEQEPDPQDGPEAQPLLDVGDAALGQDLAAVDDRDAGAQLLELGQDVAADQDRLAHRAQLAEQLAQLDPGARVEARGRLVEQQHLRIVDERVGQAQPLLHAAREGLDVGVALARRGRPARAGRRSSGAGRPAGRP